MCATETTSVNVNVYVYVCVCVIFSGAHAVQVHRVVSYLCVHMFLYV